MKEISENRPKWVRVAVFLNRRVIKTSHLRSTLYFIFAVAAFLLFYFFVLYHPF